VGVVHPLEKVDIHEEDAEEVPIPFGTLHLPVEDHVEIAAVVEFREVVDVDQALRLRASLRVDQCERACRWKKLRSGELRTSGRGFPAGPSMAYTRDPGGGRRER